MALVTALLGLLAVPTLASASSPRADLVLVGGDVWTNDVDAGSAEAIAVDGQRIVAVGSDDEALAAAAPDARVIDLDGAFVVPGFRDQHVHVLEGAASASREDYRPSYSGYDPAAATAVRTAIAGYHAAVKASGRTPEDGCSRSPVTDDLKASLLAAQEELAAQGVTTIVEAGLSDLGVLDALEELDDEGKLAIRYLVRVGWGCLEDAAADGKRTGWGSEWLQVLGVKLYSDGWLGPRTSKLRENYSDRPYDGIQFFSAERATNDVARARTLGFNITTHAIGDRAMDVVLDAYEANGVSAADRWQVEHVQVTHPDLIERFRDLGVIGSIQLSFATTDMRFAEDALGAERVAEAYAWRTMSDADVRLAGGSDFNVEVINPLWGLQRVVTRQELDGFPEGGWFPSERLDVDRALELITSDAAFASFEEDERGRLVEGAYADLVVTRENLRAIPPRCLSTATVLLTVVNGRVAFEGEQAYVAEAYEAPAGGCPEASAQPEDVSTDGSQDGARAADDSATGESAGTAGVPAGALPATGGGLAIAALLLAGAWAAGRTSGRGRSTKPS